MIKQGTSLPFSIGLFFTILLQLMSTPVMGRDKTDVVILKNGDHVTGEIKSLDRGKLSLSTDSMGTVKIEWEDVERVTSQWIFEVETEAGVRTFGSLAPASEPRTMEIIGGSARNTLNQTSVVRMTQIEAGFWNRLEGYVDIGFNFSRANRATEWTFGSEVKTRSEIRQIRTTLSSFYNDRKDVESNTRNVLGFDYTRFFFLSMAGNRADELYSKPGAEFGPEVCFWWGPGTTCDPEQQDFVDRSGRSRLHPGRVCRF